MEALKRLWNRYKQDLKSPISLSIAITWAVLLFLYKAYTDLFFHYWAVFFNALGSTITYLSYLPLTVSDTVTSLGGLAGQPSRSFLILALMIPVSIIVMPAMKIIFQFMDKIQDWVFIKIRFKKR